MSWILWVLFIILGIAVLAFIAKVIINLASGKASGNNALTTLWDACCQTFKQHYELPLNKLGGFPQEHNKMEKEFDDEDEDWGDDDDSDFDDLDEE